MKKKWGAVVCATFGLFFSLQVSALAPAPVIDNVSINYSTNTLTIRGQNLSVSGQAPSVQLNTTILKVGLFNSTAVQAKVNNSSSLLGGYLLQLTTSAGSNTFDTTFGAVGPQGPAGATGPVGPAGPEGPAGPQGAAGPEGPVGPTGPQGPPVTFQGNWSASQTYNLGDAVFYNGSSYISLIANNSGNQPDTSSTQWGTLAQQGAIGAQGPQGDAGPMGPMGPAGPVGPAGAQGPAGPIGPAGPDGPAGPAGPPGPVGATGPQGPPVAFQGTWSASTSYNLGDAVFFNGSSYISLVANNTGNEPDMSTTDWAVLAKMGATGAQGPVGPEGPSGPTGPPGAQGPVGPPGPPNTTVIYTNNTVLTPNTGTQPATYMLFAKAVVSVSVAGNSSFEGTCSLASNVQLDSAWFEFYAPPFTVTYVTTLNLQAVATLQPNQIVTLSCPGSYLVPPMIEAIPVYSAIQH